MKTQINISKGRKENKICDCPSGAPTWNRTKTPALQVLRTNRYPIGACHLKVRSKLFSKSIEIRLKVLLLSYSVD